MKALSIVFAGALLAVVSATASTSTDAPLPRSLRDTGLFAPGARLQARSDIEPFTPQHPLWSDGMDKRRWLYLPPGTSIDKSDPDRWEFPRGTRAWKEFIREARVETRLIERLADGSWRYATYVWNKEGTDAVLAPDDGIAELGIPSRADCLACHEGAPAPLLGVSAVQLTPGLVAGSTATLRATLGYLHGNCGHCHNDSALPALDLVLAQQASNPEASAQRTLASLVGRFSRFRPHDSDTALRVVPGRADKSILVARMKSHDPLTRMPPLGVEIVDAEGLALIERWIENDLLQTRQTPP